HQVERAVRARVAEVVQGARGGTVAARTPTAMGAAAGRIGAASPLPARLGQLVNASDAFGDIGHVLAWPVQDSSLLAQLPPYLYFTPALACFSAPVMLQCRLISYLDGGCKWLPAK